MKRERDYFFEAKCIISLVEELHIKTLAGNLFVDLLQEFTYLQNQLEGKYSERHMMLLQVLIVCSEVLGPDIVQNVTQVCVLMKILLSSQDVETLTLSLGIMNILLNGSIKIGQDEELLLLELIPELELLTTHEENSISELANTLFHKISSRDQSWLKSEKITPSETKESKEKIKDILRDLNDPLLPVRASGLVALRRLVLAKDPIAEKNLDRILTIFKTQIFDDDS